MNVLSNPQLYRSPLKFRIGLARKRTASFPLHTLNFIVMDLERPDLATHHSYWCTGDLSGRTLDFLSRCEGIDGGHDERLPELFERILRCRRPSGLFGRYGVTPAENIPPEDFPKPVPGRCAFLTGADRLFVGLISYYELTKDGRALESAAGVAEWFFRNKDRWAKRFAGSVMAAEFWITEPMARLYNLTRDPRCLDFCAMIHEAMDVAKLKEMHTHFFLSTMRGFQLAAIYTADPQWNEKPEYYRRKIIDQPWEKPDGNVCEGLPQSFRNEGCAIADWLMVNLNAGFISGQDDAYEHAQHILWNALFFNQVVTGGFSHRDLSPYGYKAGAIGEAWWCCTHHAGTALTEYARHAVTRRDDTIWVNLLTPGRFVLPGGAHADIEIDVTTAFPASGQAYISVKHLPPHMKVNVRVPSCLRNPSVRESRENGLVRIVLQGELGHYLQVCPGGAVLKYGPLILAPLADYWNVENVVPDGTVPAGYTPPSLPPGRPAFEPVPTTPSGFLDLQHHPLPDFSYFEEGPQAELAVEGASVNVPLKFDNGERKTVFFWPMCMLTSNMSHFDTPIVFRAPSSQVGKAGR